MSAQPVDPLVVLNEFAMRAHPFGDDTEAERKFHAAYAAITELVEDRNRLDYLERSGYPGQFFRDDTRPADRLWFDSDTEGSDYSPTLRAAIDGARRQGWTA